LARTAAEPSLEISSAAASRLRLLRSLAQRNSGLGKRTATCEAGGDAQADDDRASDGELLGPARKLIRPAIPCAPADQRRRPEVGTTAGIGDLKRRNERRCAARGNPRPRPSAGGGNFVPSAVVVARDPRTHSHGHTYPRWSQRTVSQFTYWALGNRCGPTILPSGIIVPSSSQFRARAGAGSEDDGARGSNLGWGEGGAKLLTVDV
jgi:hypothetical protein